MIPSEIDMSRSSSSFMRQVAYITRKKEKSRNQNPQVRKSLEMLVLWGIAVWTPSYSDNLRFLSTTAKEMMFKMLRESPTERGSISAANASVFTRAIQMHSVKKQLDPSSFHLPIQSLTEEIAMEYFESLIGQKLNRVASNFRPWMLSWHMACILGIIEQRQS